MPTAFITHPDCARHEMGDSHPECPERLSAISDRLIAAGLDPFLAHYMAPSVTRAQLLRVHSAAHVEKMAAMAPQTGHVWIDEDTALNPHTPSAAMRAAGALILATDLVLGDEAENAFCSVRPPGHHATRDQAMGFSIFNNVAVGVAHALEHHGVPRTAILDFDAHHGNGTEDIFRDDQRVLFCSIFQHPFYPYSGADTASERMINTPLAAGAGGEEFRAAVEEHWLPALDRFRPEIVFISAGFDGHREDDRASLRLTEADYAWVTRTIKAAAKRHCQGRIVSTLEGGYALSALARSVTEHIRALADL